MRRSWRTGREAFSGGRVARAIVGVTVTVDAGALLLGVLDRSVQSLVPTCMFAATSIAFCSLGALIVWRQVGHAIGWLFVGMALFLSVCHALAQNYAVYALVIDPGSCRPGRRRTGCRPRLSTPCSWC
jgi:Na+/melibiose symporter-like transporter